jgi:hypothetical protein
MVPFLEQEAPGGPEGGTEMGRKRLHEDLGYRRRQVPGWIWPAFFLAASVLDLGLTWLLLEVSEAAYEANPLAAAILDRHGWGALAGFKVGCAALVVGVVYVIGRRKPALAGRLTRIACVLLTCVLFYSVCLLAVDTRDPETRAILAKEEQRWQKLQDERRRFGTYIAHAERLAANIIRSESSLYQATQELAALLLKIDHQPYYQLQAHYGDLTPDACLAAQLIDFVGYQVRKEPHRGQHLLRTLAAEFARSFGPVPESALTWFPCAHDADVHRDGSVLH